MYICTLGGDKKEMKIFGKCLLMFIMHLGIDMYNSSYFYNCHDQKENLISRQLNQIVMILLAKHCLSEELRTALFGKLAMW